MDQPPTLPHLTALLHAPDSELDLSGSRPFSLSLTVTLHAPHPVHLYTADTFLSPRAALRQGGIDFFLLGSESKEPRSTIDVNRGQGPERPWLESEVLRLEPEAPVLIDIAFGSRRFGNGGEGGFDLRLWMNTAMFEAGESYKAVLPPGGKVSWWCWAEKGGSEESGGVPVLPEEEQLPIHVVDADVRFTCVGQRGAQVAAR